MTADFKQATTLAGKILASGLIQPVYTVAFTFAPTGGTFTLTISTGLNGPTPSVQSTTITYSTSLTAAAVQTAIQALTGLSAVTVTGSNGGSFLITIPTALGAATVTVTSALTGGAGGTPAAIVTGTGTSTSIYTVPANSAVKIASIAFANAAALAGTLSVSVVPAGGTSDGTHLILANYPIAAGDALSHKDVLSALDGAMLDAGAQIAVTSGVSGTYLITGAVSA